MKGFRNLRGGAVLDLRGLRNDGRGVVIEREFDAIEIGRPSEAHLLDLF